MVDSLRRTYAALFPPTGFHNASAFLSQDNNKLYLFHCAPNFMSKLAVTLLD